MSNEVYANMMEVSCKSASGKTICAMPDVCFTPPQTPATPPGVPIPYPNTGMASDATDGSTSVKISGKEVMLKNKSCFSKSSGDEAGAAPKKGVVTSKNMGKVYFNMWSMDVKVEGENVVRHLDITTHNHGSTPGNSPPMPHTDGMAPGAPGEEACPLASASCSIGSPVNPVQGTKVLAGDEDIDFTLAGPFPLEWRRYYLSSNVDAGWFGRGWSSPLEARLEAIADPSGELVERIEYVDPFARRTAFDPLAPGASRAMPGEQLTLSRTAQGQYLLSGADGLTRWFGARSQGVYRLVALTDRNGNTVYLDHGRAASGVIEVECSGRQRLEFAFEDGRLAAITELRPADGTTERVLLMRYAFTRPGGDLRQVFNRAGECVRSFEYDAERRMCKHVVAGALVAEYEYAGTGAQARVLRHWNNVGQFWAFTYAADHTAVTDQDGRTTLYHFDANKRLIGVTDSLGQVSQVGVDKRGNVCALIDPAERITESRFDERGNPVEVRAPDGGVTTLEWHPDFPVPVAMTDPLNRTTVYQYDAKGNRVSELDAAGAETKYEHDERGLVVAVVNAIGGVARYAYNERGQVIQHTDCSGNVTRYAFDANGWLVGTTNALGEQTRFEYDAAGRLVRQVLADGTDERYENDLAGRLTAFINGVNARTEFRYEPDGQLAQRTDALGNVTRYHYDRARRLIELVNENGAVYRFGYDALGRVIEETRFDGTQVRAAYDRSGYLVETVEEPDSAERIVFRYVRDALGRLLRRASARGADATFEYDAAGQRIRGRTENPPIDVRMAYDEAGRRTEERVMTSDRAYAISHRYDALGNRLETVLPDGSRIGALYYGCGYVHQISLDQVPVVDFERDALHREVIRTQGALTGTREYSAGGRLQRQRARPVDGEPASQIDRLYQYDGAGRLVLTQEPGVHLRYGYDAVDQLTRFNEERFAYDPAHNRVPANGAAALVPDNRVTALEAHRYRYDAHGRVVEKRSASGTLVRMQWNDDHRLTAATTIDSSGGSHSTHYLYDAFGRRIAKRNGQGTTWFVWDCDRLLQEYRDVGSTTFLYEPETFVPLAQASAPAGAAAAASRSLLFYHCDQVGVPRELTNEEGRLVWAGRYTGWGRLAGEQLAAAGAPRPPLRLQGEYVDEETGLHYSLMRYYDPDASRFISRDPIGLLGGDNEYRYAPNPVFWIDPWGLTGTYIFTDGTNSYIGKGPVERCKSSQSQRMGSTCGATAAVHKDFGDDDMGFMVEHLLMEKYKANTPGSGFLNADGLSSPGKKKYEAADAATKKKARAKRDAMVKEFEAKKKACAAPAGPPPNNGNC